ncbi:hypothetical protein CFC35_00020 [Streptomyces sp. FBKL.4005]|nr:hypothetical protein CFC35_00020 [Streptomyces sp. FBKL.4005]BCM64710.1 hypothetical protein EASAB2608_00044 [Streptomyces sp. EAS-AB2608]CUW32638.1 hypothetical protein TUE45_pSRTUE45c_0006 [Streptomyces reticuli]
MTPFLVPLAAALLIVAASTVVGVRRDRRRMAAGVERPRTEGVTPLRAGCGTRHRAPAYEHRSRCERE